MNSERRPSGRAEPREIVELREIKALQPELGPAVDMHIALFDLQRRVQSRVSLPWLAVDAERLRHQQLSGDPLLRFEEIPVNWTDFRLMVRQATDILHRFEAIDHEDHARIQALARDGHALEPIVEHWYTASAARQPAQVGVAWEGIRGGALADGAHGAPAREAERGLGGPASDRAGVRGGALANGAHGAPAREAARGLGGPASDRAGVRGGAPIDDDQPAMLGQVLTLAIRPFLVRCAEAVMPRIDLTGWLHGYCPLCGWDPELAVITPTADRRLLCGRCSASWKYDPIACPFCRNADRTRITSFATRDGRYRMSGCDCCHRYIKAYDARHSARPVIPAVDTVATLPLDAEAIRKGYEG